MHTDRTIRQLQDQLQTEKNKLAKSEEQRNRLKEKHANLHRAYVDAAAAQGLFLADVREAEEHGPVREDWETEARRPFPETPGNPPDSPGSPSNGKRKRQDDDE